MIWNSIGISIWSTRRCRFFPLLHRLLATSLHFLLAAVLVFADFLLLLIIKLLWLIVRQPNFWLWIALTILRIFRSVPWLYLFWFLWIICMAWQYFNFLMLYHNLLICWSDLRKFNISIFFLIFLIHFWFCYDGIV